MRKFQRLYKIAVLIALTAMLGVIPVQAGEWKEDGTGRWYDNGDGTYKQADWLLDNGKWYYFREDGYLQCNAWVGNYYVGADGVMLASTTTPDGYQVGADGAWIPDTQAGIQDNRYLDAYAAILRSYKNPAVNPDKPRFSLLYIDGDAIPELLISQSGCNSAGGELYHYYQGTVQELGEFGCCGGFSYTPQANVFYYDRLQSGLYVAAYYTIQDNNCVPLIWFGSYSREGAYDINNFSVTKGEFDSQFAAWKASYPMSNDADYYSGYEINETNIQKMLENFQNVMANDKHVD